MNANQLDIFNIIALRKNEFFNRIWYSLKSKFDDLNGDEKVAIRSALVKTIAEMQNRLFIADDELIQKRIYKDRNLEQLGLDGNKVVAEFKRSMKRKYPTIKLS